MYKFKLPIGDWSDDGHGKCDYFIIESNINPEDLVEIVHNLDNKHKFSDICSNYGEYEIKNKKLEYLKSIGLNTELYFEDNCFKNNTKSFAQLFLDLIMLENSNINLKIINDDIIEFNNWFGQKISKKRNLTLNNNVHVLTPLGYGLFD